MAIGFTRRHLLGGIAVLGAAALTGCGANNGSPGSGSGTNLRFAWWGNDVRMKLTREALDLFEAANPGVKVAGESGSFDSYFEKLATQVAGNDAPDVFQMNEWTLREYADRGALLDLGAHGFSDADWPEGANGTGVVNGTTYGGTAGVGLQAVMVNPKFFEDAKVDIPDDTSWTWQDFHQVAAELTHKSPDGAYGTSFGGGDQITSTYFLGQLGTALFAGDEVRATGAELGQWFDLWKGMVDDKTLPGAAQIAEQSALPAEQQPFSQGKIGMQVIPANTVVQSEKSVGHELRLLRIPTLTGKKADLGMWYRASLLFCASARTRSADQAGALVNYLLNTTEAGQVLLADRGVPANTKVLAAVTEKLTPVDRRVVDYLEACREDLVPAPEPPPAGAGTWPKILGRAAEDVIFGRSSSVDAATAALDELKGGMKK